MNHPIRAAAVVIFLSAGLAGAAVTDEDARSALAFSYREGKGATVDLVGVRPLSGMLGEAQVKRNEGRTRVKLEMQALPHPQTLGSLYTAYVLWAIAPEGRAENMAELRHSQAFDVDVTTSFPSFALVVTAEPHAGVLRPGPRLVAENAANLDDDDALEIGRVDYVPAAEFRVATLGTSAFTTPLPLVGARRAVEIARADGALEFAPAELREAEIKLAALEQLQMGKDKLSRESESLARDVMRVSEQARVVAAARRDEERAAGERSAARRRLEAAEDEAERARMEAEQLRLEAEREQLRARQAREEAEALAEAQRRAQAAATEAQARVQAAQAEAQAQVRQAQAEAERSREQAQQALHDKAEMQERLFRSLSSILETRREARGLIVNLSDVLFDSGQASLKPGAREKLSRLAGIMLAYPGAFHIEVEGHTDSVGSEEYNQRLSHSRADSVRTYLSQAGIATDRFTKVTGFGESKPVATNINAAGRQQNRRVEIVITDLDQQ
jgi:outer membrane protein OmpA-like peptidoglycan-associated protein